MAGPSQPLSRERISRLAQEREFHKYYLVGPTGPDLGDHSSTNATPTPNTKNNLVAQHSRDTTLTAFAQLGALRLNARRAMISLFNRTHQHVLAEATRTLSLQTGLPDVEEDGLWLGVKALPREYGVCAHVVDLIPRIPSLGGSGIIRKSILMVPDLRKDPRFQTRGFVADFPDARFYAAVPIISPKGIVIGVFCIVDDRPRDGLNPALVSFMAEMSKTVMNHLSLAQSREASHRGERMIDGLGSFIEGKATLRGSAREARLAEINVHLDNEAMEGHLDPQQQKLLDSNSPNEGKAGRRRDSMSGDFPRPDHQRRPIEKLLQEKSTERVQTLHNDTNNLPSDVPSHSIISSGVDEAFSRAANLTRESMQIEGAIFFDASIRSPYTKGVHTSRVESSDTENISTGQSSGSEDLSDSIATPPEIKEASGTTVDSNGIATCQVLGASTTLTSSINTDGDCIDKFVMHENLLRSLLRRYPRGKIFNFDETGSISSGDTSDGSTRQLSKSLEKQDGSDPRPRFARKKSTREARRRAEAKDIIEIFPGARSLIFLPLWDSHRSRWFSGVIVWTCMPQRVFSVAPDLLFLYAFGNNLMAEIHRLDIETTNNQHATLISSISHELRSPLHGLLGSLDLFRDAALDPMHRNMIQTMESCGQTLLDIINHLLDFAKINQSHINQSVKDNTTKRRHNSKSRKATKLAMKRNHDGKKNPTIVHPNIATPDVDLSAITEEVVDAVYAGHCFHRIPKPQSHTSDIVLSAQKRAAANHVAITGDVDNVAVILDIDQNINWEMKMDPGAWRRILMNIFGNSLKHTSTGWIYVKLSSSPRPSMKQSGREEDSSAQTKMGSRSRIWLAVKDTGRGISQEYLQNHLYTPFSQENPLLPGNGLGLSIVRHTVQSLGGSIDIQSTEESGCDVSVHFDASPAPLATGLQSPFPVQAIDPLQPKNLAFVRFNPPAKSDREVTSLVEKSLKDLCEKPLGIEVKTLDFQSDFEICDYYFLAQLGTSTVEDLATQMCVIDEKRRQHCCLKNPLIVSCTTPFYAQKLLAIAREADGGGVREIISQPCGPRKFAKTLELCSQKITAPPPKSDGEPFDQVADGPMFTPNSYSMIHMNQGAENEDQSYTTLKRSDQSDREQAERLEVGTLAFRERPKPHTSLSAVPEADNTTSGSSPSEVMIVDDNEINQKLLVAFMRKQDLPFAIATNGLEAVESFKATPRAFRLILMDLTMPVMDGLTATREIRQIEQHYLSSLDSAAKSSWRPVKVVAVTGLGSAEIQQDAFNAGVDVFLTRPVRFDELRGILKSDN